MFTWNVKEMKLTNAKLLENGVWEFENEVSREDKLAFVDGRTGGRKQDSGTCRQIRQRKRTAPA